MRVTEMYHVINSMVRLSQGNDVTRTSVKTPDFDWALWRGTVAVDKPIMTGHSLGGSAAVCNTVDVHAAAC
jgi:platelet-activating factor acetylhydrolase